MKYTQISKDLFINNRNNFRKYIKPGSIAVFNSNDVLPTNADGTMPFRQNNDLFYLCGIDQEDTILILFPDNNNPQQREMLFIKETNEHIAVWEGQKLSKKQATEISGIETVYYASQFDSFFNALVPSSSTIYLNSNEHLRATKSIDTKDDRFIKICKERFPLHQYQRSAPIMEKLRAIKSDIEIELIKHACDITRKTFLRLLKFVKPGVMEYEIEAEVMHEFLRNRSKGPAYQSIVASGENACILHYIDNDKVCKDGDLILLDVGAEYANYASDMTRTIPANGRFTKRQREVYNAVLKVMREATKLLVPGNNMSDYQKEIGTIMEGELINLGLLSRAEVNKQDKDKPLYRKYFMHGVSHALGLDVHDVFDRKTLFKEGMIFTCEPGIYIREEKLGIRLENDILISSGEAIDLMKNIPIEIEEIEEIMNTIN